MSSNASGPPSDKSIFPPDLIPTSRICPLCTSDDLSILVDIDSRLYWRCHECKLTFLSPEHYLAPAAERARYLQHNNHPQDAGYRKFLSRLTSHLLPKLRPGSEGLDYGCGPGPTLSVMLEERGFPMRLYDPYFAPGNDSLNRQYDFITCTETFEHFKHPGRELVRINQLIRRGGWLGVMTEMLGADTDFSDWHYHRDPTHICFFKRETMDWIACRFGWKANYPGKNITLYQSQRDPTPL